MKMCKNVPTGFEHPICYPQVKTPELLAEFRDVLWVYGEVL
jgi:hypothetical protein